MNAFRFWIITVIGFCCSVTVAQTFTPKEEIKASEKKTLGWNKSSNIGLNFSFTNSSDVVGQTDGTSEVYGVNLKGSFTRLSESDEWRNTFGYIGNTTKTPSVPRYVKASDELKIESIYLYSLESYPKVGPYVRGEASAPMFRGEDVRAADVTYAIDYRTDPDSTLTASSLRLTDGFKPLNTKESVGFFYKAVQEENFKLELRTGFGALQVQADGQLAVTGTDSATGNIIVKELRNVNQAGLEFGASLKAKADEKTTYEAGVETLTPFINDKEAGDDRDAIRLTNIEGFAKLTSNLASWASLGFEYKVKIQPQVVDRTQQISMMVLNINHNLF